MASGSEHKRIDAHGAPRVRTIYGVIVVMAVVFAIMLLQVAGAATKAFEDMQYATDEYVACTNAANIFTNASDYLTSESRLFSITHDPQHVKNYYREVNETRRRDEALDILEGYALSSEAKAFLKQAMTESNILAEREGTAMLLVATASGVDDPDVLEELSDYVLSDSELKLEPAEQLRLSQELLFGDEYVEHKELIDSNVTQCTDKLLETTKKAQNEASSTLQSLLFRQQVLTALLFIAIVVTILLNIGLVLWPLASYEASMADGLPLEARGSHELRSFASKYNELYEENRRHNDSLRHKAEHDPLTGLFNRGAYDEIMASCEGNVALMLVDVDYFKGVNDTYGHEVGDAILRKVSKLLEHTFRSTDYPCRVGGDEFAVIITDITPALKRVLVHKIEHMRETLLDTSDGLPKVTLSIGTAFSTNALGEAGESNLFELADQALYFVKDRGRNNYAFYDEIDVETADKQ